MKKSVFELGGSDAFIVLEDADIDLAVSKAITGRLHTNGQACNNSKRFIIQHNKYEEFTQKLLIKLKEYVKIGDPMEKGTTIGPLAQKRGRDNLREQVKNSVLKGAKVLYGNVDFEINDQALKDGYFFEPMVLENITKTQPAYSEELFGPVFSLFRYRDPMEAIEIANDI